MSGNIPSINNFVFWVKMISGLEITGLDCSKNLGQIVPKLVWMGKQPNKWTEKSHLRMNKILMAVKWLVSDMASCMLIRPSPKC